MISAIFDNLLKYLPNIKIILVKKEHFYNNVKKVLQSVTVLVIIITVLLQTVYQFTEV